MSQTKIAELLSSLSLDPQWAERVKISGSDPLYNTPWRVGMAGATALGLQAAIINNIHHLRNDTYQNAAIDMIPAAMSLSGVLFQRLRDYKIAFLEPHYPVTNFYQCRDGKWIFLHGGYPALRNGILELLGTSNSVAAIQNAVAQWNSSDLENAIASKGLCGAVLRSPEEWLQSEQGDALANEPVVKVTKINDSDPVTLSGGNRPLSAVNVLDLTHVLAGPMSTRLLAEQGASVLHVAGPKQPVIPSFVMDTGWGKRNALLDLSQDKSLAQLHNLMKECDIFAQSYRPNALNKFGLSPDLLAQSNPGIICVNISCYGSVGPWRLRPGWEQLGQTVSGLVTGHSSLDAPQLLPCCICDYVTGYMAAAGALAALVRRAKEGGSYLVDVSLARSGMWVQEFGKVSPHDLPPKDLSEEVLNSHLQTRSTPYGPLKHLKPVSQFSETTAKWSLPSVPTGHHSATWSGEDSLTCTSGLCADLDNKPVI